IGTLAAALGTGSVQLTHGGSGDLTIGSLGATEGITASSATIATTDSAANLIFAEDVTTSGTQTYAAARGITVNANVALEATDSGSISLTANEDGDGTGNFAGILLNGGSLIQTA